jgi:hypothetical protein
MSSVGAVPLSPTDQDLRLGLRDAVDLGAVGAHQQVGIRAALGARNLWLAVSLAGTAVLHLRLGPNAGEITNVQRWAKRDGTMGLEFTTSMGPMRAKLRLYDDATMRCTTSLVPVCPTAMGTWPRDVYVTGAERGIVHTAQRGLRTGLVYASSFERTPFTLLYWQNFSALSEYLSAVNRTPADTVGGQWPLLGYAPPAGDDCVLPASREVVISDAFLSLAGEVPQSEDGVAELYLDLLARQYRLLEKPPVEYHDWPARAEHALRDLTLSPGCTYVRGGRRYLTPYVADRSKPPESMVQFTVAVNAGEYDGWRGSESLLARTLRAGVPSFFDADLHTVVRWLPGEAFDEGQAEENMSHEAMDSWYLHHAAFNLFRLGHDGCSEATELFRKSLPYIIRVARRFDYRWPIFFDLRTLDIIRAEASPGKGGENDVAGLYALVMIHAHEMFGDAEYLAEAEAAIRHLHGLGFNLAYQLNTTGFAAEAALRLWKLTGKSAYLGLSNVCLANLFDNMWLWQCTYGNASSHPTFFGLFPLRDAPYLAAYEELEALAKFAVYLALGGSDLRPSVGLLLAEYQKYALHRCWYYYPDTLLADALAPKARNGRIERALSVPIEDLQDGRALSGQVGQEVYGAGVAFVMTTRHYMRLERAGLTIFADYPMHDFSVTANGARWRSGGNADGEATLRIVPAGESTPPQAVAVFRIAGSVRVPVAGTVTPEGHAAFPLRGEQHIEIRCAAPGEAPDAAIVIGPLATQA